MALAFVCVVAKKTLNMSLKICQVATVFHAKVIFHIKTMVFLALFEYAC